MNDNIHIVSRSSALPGAYSFKLQCVNFNGASGNIQKTCKLNLTVVPESGGIFVDLDKYTANKGNPIGIYGNIYPPFQSKLVQLSAFHNQNVYSSSQVYTDIGGIFQQDKWTDIFEPGTYIIQASWTDANSRKHTASSRALTIEKMAPEISCFPGEDKKPSIDQDFSIMGQLYPNLSFEQVYLNVSSAEGQDNQTYSLFTNNNGNYHISKPFFDQNGLWTFKAYFMGNDNAIGCESDPYKVLVGNNGCAIIVGGGSLQDVYWQVTRSLINEAYQDFRRLGFTDDMIHLMIDSKMIDIDNDDIPDNVVDTNEPSVDRLIHTIQYEFSDILNQDDTLYVYMQGHGTSNSKFKILGVDESISSKQLNDAFNHLQNRTGCHIVLILECCYSGSFIQDLSHPRRIIITSAGNEPYNTDSSGRISLSRYLFSRMTQGNSILKAFAYAKNQLTSKKFPSPLLDDNGDGLANNTDGLIASTSFMTGILQWGRPEIASVKISSILNARSSLPVEITVESHAKDIQKVWAQIIPPASPISSGIHTIHFPETELTYKQDNRYSGTIDHLSYDGTYTVLLYAKSVTNEISDPRECFVRVTNVGRKIDFDGDGHASLEDLIVVLRSLCGLSASQNCSLLDAVYLMQYIAML